MKKRYYYYFDEKNDDFAGNDINGEKTPKNYEYLPKNIFYRIFKPVVYYLVLPIVSLAVTLMGVRIKNRKVFRNRRDRKKGYFIYSNHTGSVRDVFSAPKVSFPHQCCCKSGRHKYSRNKAARPVSRSHASAVRHKNLCEIQRRNRQGI